jgi:beta-glucanase (GH16 family)
MKKFDFSSTDKVFQEWNVITLDPYYYNNEKQAYTTSPKNVFTRDNHLVIKAFKDGDSFTSGRLESKQNFSPFQSSSKKLRVEFTGKVPTVMGAWPAYWMLGDDKAYGQWPMCGEIDVMEWVQSISGIYQATLHWGGAGGPREAPTKQPLTPGEMATTWITYGVEYSAVPNQEYIQYYVRRENGQVSNGTRLDPGTWKDFPKCPEARFPGGFPCSPLAPFDNQMRLIIDLAVGGDWGGIGVTNYDAFNGGVEFETTDVTVCEKL